jgi:signal transduction histidine kinase
MWQRPWFFATLLFAVLLAAYAVYRYRISRLLEVVNMRTRIATDLHDDIGADLTKIALLSEVARRQMGENGRAPDSPLPSIARISREAVATMSDIVWAINPRRDSVRDLVSRMRQHAEEVFTLRGIGLTFNAPENGEHSRLSVDVRRDVFLIFKEAVNNAARHSGCSRAAIDFHAAGSALELRVADDGVGFDPEDQSEGHGLMSMRRRALALGGSLRVQSSVGAGTIVVFERRSTRARRSSRAPGQPV